MIGVIVSINAFWFVLGVVLLGRFIKFRKLKADEICLLHKLYSEEKARFKSDIANLENKIITLNKLAIVSQQSENAVMLMDADGNIEWVNNSFTRMYEYTYQEFIASLGDNIRKTSFNPKIIERLNRCVSSKRAVTYEALNITRSGKQLWTHTSLIPLLGEDDTVIGLVTIDSDIHKRIDASELLIRHVVSFNFKLEKITEQLNFMVELTNILFERIDKSQTRIEKTNQIITYVKGISDETKILGINASIEANSAGNYGKGFRVIAGEMVSISNRTIQSLKEINDLIESVKQSSDKLGNERKRSEAAISLHRHLIEELQQEISEIEQVVLQLKA